MTGSARTVEGRACDLRFFGTLAEGLFASSPGQAITYQMRRGFAAAHCGKPLAYRQLIHSSCGYAALRGVASNYLLIISGKAEPFRYVLRRSRFFDQPKSDHRRRRVSSPRNGRQKYLRDYFATAISLSARPSAWTTDLRPGARARATWSASRASGRRCNSSRSSPTSSSVGL